MSRLYALMYRFRCALVWDWESSTHSQLCSTDLTVAGGLEIFSLGTLTAACAYLIGWGVETAILNGEGGVPVR